MPGWKRKANKHEHATTRDVILGVAVQRNLGGTSAEPGGRGNKRKNEPGDKEKKKKRGKASEEFRKLFERERVI